MTVIIASSRTKAEYSRQHHKHELSSHVDPHEQKLLRPVLTSAEDSAHRAGMKGNCDGRSYFMMSGRNSSRTAWWAIAPPAIDVDALIDLPAQHTPPLAPLGAPTPSPL